MTNAVLPLDHDKQPLSTFESLERLVDQTIGVKLFTLMEIDHINNVVRRNYSNHPDAYPASGTKPRHKNEWTEIVEQQQQIFVANSIDEIAAVFPDYELIQSLGCESCVNIPVVVAGTVIGTLNCLHEAGYYTPAKVQAAENLKYPGAIAFLLDAYLQRTSTHG